MGHGCGMCTDAIDFDQNGLEREVYVRRSLRGRLDKRLEGGSYVC